MGLSMILAIARAEMRSVRRLVRYWIFAVLSVGITFLIYMQYAFMHFFASRLTATAGAMAPRFLITAVGVYILGIFLLGLIFLAFDVRARDERERMAEVLDARPLSNVELLVGRCLGLVLMAWAPVIFVALIFQAFGFLALSLDWWLGEPVEPYSLFGFVVLDALTSFVLWCSLIVLLAVVVRNRLVVAIAALALAGLQIWSLVRMPIYLLPALSAVSAVGTLGSDLIPRMTSGPALVQRLALWVLSAGLIALAAAFHPRPDSGSKTRRVAVGSALVALAGLTIGTLAWQASARMSQRREMLEIHTARQHDPRPLTRKIAGTVSIDPGRRIDLDLRLHLQAPADAGLDSLLFAFNPGLEVESIRVGGADATWTHEYGLLEVSPSQTLRASEEIILELVAGGAPDISFGYLDSGIDVFAGNLMNAQLALLGTDVGSFSSRYVALLPGGRWLPYPGTDVPNGDPQRRPMDYFELDLEVEVPKGWLVAGPGRRETVGASTAKRERFRFRPGAPVPEVGLLASRFERYATEVAGVELEILINPKHLRNMKLFADAEEELKSRIEEILTDAEKLGLAYPYGGFSVVETPSSLRGYGGGWRMDTVQALPGLLLLRENSFPSSRFNLEFRDPERFEEREGGIARFKVEVLERFFENDFSGGNIFLAVSRNFLLFQTGARGEGAVALDFICQELMNRLLTGKEGYFSAYLFDQSSMQGVIGETITDMIAGRTDSIAEAVMHAASDKPSVWDLALGTSLAALDPYEDPKRSINVLALKSRAIALSILDGLGREKTGLLLATLLERHRGGHFTAEDFAAISLELDADLEPIIGDWLHEAALPGFVTSPVVVERLVDDDDGNPRYQTRLHVLNDEPTPGLFRMRYSTGEGTSDADRHESEPLRLAAYGSIEIGLLSSSPPRELWLQPYLSLNRQDVQLTLPRIDQEEQSVAEAFLGGRPSDWRPAEEEHIVVDDLDPGFSIETDEVDNGMRLGGGLSTFFFPTGDMDQGLPEYQEFGPPPRGWTRRELDSSFGKYRHTVALVRSGSGKQRAIFAADLPRAGLWRLEYYLPVLTSQTRSTSGPGFRINARIGLGGSQGTYDVTLDAGGEQRQLEFDASAAEPGWNSLGEFALSAGEARVLVSDETSGRLVIADAIRWRSLTEGGSTSGSR